MGKSALDRAPPQRLCERGSASASPGPAGPAPAGGLETSVALATRNGGLRLVAQLASLVAQTLPPAEVVICRDGPDDRTLGLARSFSDRLNLRVVGGDRRLDRRDGLLQAASACTRPIVALYGQDDVWPPHMLERCVTRLGAVDAILVVHPAVDLGEHRRPGRGRTPSAAGRICEPLTLFPYAGDALGRSLVFRRELLGRVDAARRPADPLDPRRPLAPEDWVLLLASIFGRVAMLDEDPPRRRRQADAPSRDRGKNDAEEIGRAHRARARFYAQVAQTLDPTAQACAWRTYQDLASQYAARASIYDGRNLAVRLLALASLIEQGGYRNVPRGRAGLPAMAPDILVGVTRLLAD